MDPKKAQPKKHDDADKIKENEEGCCGRGCGNECDDDKEVAEAEGGCCGGGCCKDQQ